MSDATKKLMSSKRTGELNPLYGKSPFFFPFFLIIIKLLHISLYIIIKKRKKNKAGDDTKELMRQKALGRKFSEETKLLMSKASPRGNRVNIYEKFSSEGFELIGSFVSARRAGKFLSISGSTIIKYMKSGAVFKDRYKFSSK
jgi:group I intron endonuclease